MNIAAIPQAFPQFGKSIWNVSRSSQATWGAKPNGIRPSGKGGCGGKCGGCAPSARKGRPSACGCSRCGATVSWGSATTWCGLSITGCAGGAGAGSLQVRGGGASGGAGGADGGGGDQPSCPDLCPKESEALRNECNPYPMRVPDFQRCNDRHKDLQRCCRRECRKKGQGRSKKGADSCKYGDANICCKFKIPAIGGMLEPQVVSKECVCCWKLDCVCCKMGDSDGARCVRGCVYCMAGGGPPDVDVHNECMKSCRDQGRWTPQDEAAFRQVASDCVRCNDPDCYMFMDMGVAVRDSVLAGLADCKFSSTAGGLAASAPGCSDEDRNS